MLVDSSTNVDQSNKMKIWKICFRLDDMVPIGISGIIKMDIAIESKVVLK
jgi:hypothetical protein